MNPAEINYPTSSLSRHSLTPEEISQALKIRYRQAIAKLQEQNQEYVNRKGITRFSKEQDRIIADLIAWYNHTETRNIDNELKEKLFAIIQLFGIPVSSLLQYSVIELWHEVRFQNFETFRAISRIYLNDVLANLTIRRGVCDCYKTNIELYPNEDLQSHLLEVSPELSDYYQESTRDINSTLNQFEKDFYAGTFKPSANETR